MIKINWRKWNRVNHRDLGYLFFGMTIIYALSGIFLNHIKQWNSNYDIQVQTVTVQIPEDSVITKQSAVKLLEPLGEAENFKNFYFPMPSQLKIFFKNGSMEVNLNNGSAVIERLERRPVLFHFNFLHYNPGIIWAIFSDIFSVSLILISITGLFIIRGKKGITGRGAWLTMLGIIVPLVFLFLYI